MTVISFGAGVFTWVKYRPAPVAGIAPRKAPGICDPTANDHEH
jgi:hypothetical protein